MNVRRWAVLAVGLVVVALALWQILAPTHGLEIVTLRSTTPPLTLVAPKGVDLATRPLVLMDAYHTDFLPAEGRLAQRRLQ